MHDEPQTQPESRSSGRAAGARPRRAAARASGRCGTAGGGEAPPPAVLRRAPRALPRPAADASRSRRTASRRRGCRRTARVEVLGYLGREAAEPFAMLYDLGGVDERERLHREGMPDAAFSVFYHLVSYGRNADVRLKVALPADEPQVDSVTGVWPAADWYERELWDMFGVDVAGHPAPPPPPHAAVVGRAPAAQGAPVPRHRVRPVRAARPAGRRAGRSSSASSPRSGTCRAPRTTPR